MGKAVNAIEDATPVVQSDVSSSTVKLSIGGADQSVATETGMGVVAYRGQTVTVELDNVSQYFLQFYGNDVLDAPAGGTTVEGVGDEGVLGKDIQPGTWGYAWDASGALADEEMRYATVPTHTVQLDKPVLVDNAVNFTGKLNFAANFPNNATLGSYTSTATLTLIATPKANTGVVNLWRNTAGELTAVDAGTDEMQGVDASFCGEEVGEGWTIDLRDNRGDKPVTYTIVKLRDGNCWMQENLRLGDTTKSMHLAPGDTDLPDNMTWELPKIQESVANTWTDDNTVVLSREGSEEYGNYYTWCAATAGSCSEAVSNGQTASASVCPKGWKLPTGGGSEANGTGQFGVLLNGLDMASVMAPPYNYAATGFINTDGSVSGAGNSGMSWSSTSVSEARAYYLFFHTGGFNPGTSNHYRYFGMPVRCVHDRIGAWQKPNGHLIPTSLRNMQDISGENFTQEYCANDVAANNLVPIESTIRLRDSRDNKVYTVVKLKDGNCWMQQNLRLNAFGGALKLTPNDTDIDEDWTLPVTLVGSGTTVNGWQNENDVVLSATFNDAIYGTYYSWCAATAGTCSKAVTANDVASGSICPKGWHLPSGGGDGVTGTGEFGLLNGLNSESVQRSPYSFSAAGFIRDKTLYSAGSYGDYWASTAGSDINAYGLYFYDKDFAPGTHNVARYRGYSVRCIAD